MQISEKKCKIIFAIAAGIILIHYLLPIVKLGEMWLSLIKIYFAIPAIITILFFCIPIILLGVMVYEFYTVKNVKILNMVTPLFIYALILPEIIILTASAANDFLDEFSEVKVSIFASLLVIVSACAICLCVYQKNQGGGEIEIECVSGTVINGISRTTLKPGQMLSIGREGGSANVMISGAPQISKMHCLIMYTTNNDIILKDVSSNGTMLNGMTISKNMEIKIKRGDELQLPQYVKFRVK